VRNKFLAAVFAATMTVSGLAGVAPASAIPTTQTAETPTLLTHTNSILGTDAVLTLTPATWGAGIFAAEDVFFEFVLTNSCTLDGTTQYLIVPSGSNALSGGGTIFTVPDQLDLNFQGTLGSYQTAGKVVWAFTVGENANNYGSSQSVGFELGVGFCGGGLGLTPPPPPPPPPLPPLAAPPYTGPMITPPAGVIAASAGGKVTIPGSRLGDVSKVEIAGLNAEITVSSDGELSIVVPSGLAAGVYDLVINSSSGRLTVQGAIRVTGSAPAATASEVRPSTRLVAENRLKVWAFGAVGAGKVQIKLNGQEVAWANALSADDPKLRDGYLVRTLTLSEGKNVIEVYVDGERVSRRVATGS